MLYCVGLEKCKGGRLPSNGPHRLVMDHYRTMWTDLKEFTHSATHGVIVITKLEDNVEEPAKRLAEDVKLFGG